MPRHIAFLTDFGSRGQHYVAEMKGVALMINPEVRLIDISHQITPFSIREAAYVLLSTYATFPKDTIFVCVVDPGVGTDREVLAFETVEGYTFIGPNNGIFSYFQQFNLIKICVSINDPDFYYEPYRDLILNSKNKNKTQDPAPNITGLPKLISDLDPSHPAHPSQSPPNLDSDMEYFMTIEQQIQNVDQGLSDIDIDELSSSMVSPRRVGKVVSTFEGRDVMTPVAAHISAGLDLISVGDLFNQIEVLSDILPHFETTENKLIGTIQYIDSFGNIISNISGEYFYSFEMGQESLRFSISNKNPYNKAPLNNDLNNQATSLKSGEGKADQTKALSLASTFNGYPPEQYLIIQGSSEFMEICCNQASAAEMLGAKVDQQIEIYFSKSPY